MGLNPVEVPKKFFRVNLQFLKFQLSLRRSYVHLKLYFRSSHHHSVDESTIVTLTLRQRMR